jgi:signal transduction histidine kinase/CheY-like chemotaxis protein
LPDRAPAAPATVNDPSLRGVAKVYTLMEEERHAADRALQAQKLESLSLLAAGLAHDFNNFLVGILTAADMLRRDLPPGGEPQQLAELIRKAAERASGLCRQMLLYAGKGTSARRPLALEVAAENCLASLAGRLPGNVVLVRSFALDLPAVQADAAQLTQLITSLVVNAAEALGAEGGRVRVSVGVEDEEHGINDRGQRANNDGVLTADPSCPSSFVLRPSGAGDHVYLEVSDDGCGLGADVLSRMFDPFFSTKGKGRGLGLCSVLGAVRAHGGGIRAVSAPGVGTAIRVLLPAARGAAAPEPCADAPRPSRGRLVLLIDDEVVVREVTARALARLGLEVVSAASAREGLDLFRARVEAVSLVILDLGLPDQDSSHVLAALRAERPDLRVILTTGSDPGPLLERSSTESTCALLPKPYTVHALLDLVGRALPDLPSANGWC